MCIRRSSLEVHTGDDDDPDMVSMSDSDDDDLRESRLWWPSRAEKGCSGLVVACTDK